MDYGFPKLYRIRKSWEYQQVWKMGCKLHTPHFILLVAKNVTTDSRLGLTVSRKIGNAVVRNRVKRLTREFFRRNKHKFPFAVDFSVVAKKGVAALSAKEIYTELQRVFEFRGISNG